jgi:hypothetical protein
VGDAEWESHADIKESLPSVDYLGNERHILILKAIAIE